MPVICLEGALAVGKTTAARTLAARSGAFVVPEMNRLFHPGDPDAPDRRSFGAYVAEQPPDWYLLRQVDRWRMADEGARTHPFAILDRDPFQPLWHRWAFGYEGAGQTLDDLVAFYRPRLAEGSLRFPDAYFLLTAPMDELRRRKEADATRDRRGFEGQKRFIEPQKTYFAAMRRFDARRVHLLPPLSPEEAVAQIQDRVSALSKDLGPDDSLALFDLTTDWLRRNPAS